MPVLNWIGKDAVVAHDAQVPFRLLHDVPELSCQSVRPERSGPQVREVEGQVENAAPNITDNLIVEGDNLLALKALLPHYDGQVKCIYIDPPYNTGNEGWVYNDAVNSPQMREWLGKVVGKEAEDLTRHDKWLCMMYPGVMLRAYREFEERVGEVRKRTGSKAEQVREVVLARQEPFSISEVEADCPGISRETVRITLREMSREGLIASTGKGRSANWVRKP